MMTWMEVDYKMDFCKLSRMNFFEIAKFGLEIFENFEKCYFNTRFLQEILSFS